MTNSQKPTRVLLGSGGIATEERTKSYRSLVTEHFYECNNVVFVPFASQDHPGYTSRMQEFLGRTGQKLKGLHESSSPLEEISRADAIYVGGGNSFLLNKELHDRGLLEPIREAVLSGTPYLGVSAGANVACPTMMTTNDMPIVYPDSFESLGIVPFQINPHYYPGKIIFSHDDKLEDHFGESRLQRISEYHNFSEIPVLGMWEGSFVHWNGTKGRLTGRATSFVRGQKCVELADGTIFDRDLMVEVV